MDVVLFSPEIPQNTGSVARLCAGTGVGLHLVGPLGFSLEDRYLKRAGLDYWGDVCLGVHKDLDSLLTRFAGRPVYFLSKKAERRYTDVAWTGEEVLVFGPESTGLPDWVLGRYGDACLRIPVRPSIRSLNLAAAVHVVVYHALERLGFPGIP
ncbi:MAG: tRNA (cytidine(34)-2'-O)-methyltransferase [Deltaproteobacteria bacterium]|nr:tRNA (cytidine(34)-2'-O)-methyltransferase [Deltaproteobacteria bacterium]